MVRSKDEFMTLIKSRLPENDMSDEDIAFLEDVTDTIEDYDTRTKDNTDWENKYKELDSEWRRKYTERFFSKEVTEPEPVPSEPDEPKVMTYEDLFKTE